MPDNTTKRIPRQRGNIPEPAARKVPIGILNEKNMVSIPKRKIAIAPLVSFLFNALPHL
jgi:hypothetical protein